MKCGTPRRTNQTSTSFCRAPITADGRWRRLHEMFKPCRTGLVGGHNGHLMARILVTEEIADGGLDRLRAAGHEVDVQLDLDQLLTHIKGAHALIVRSATQVTSEVLDVATELL